MDEEYYRLLVQYFYETINIDNVKPLKLLVYPKEDLQPLVDCLTKTRVCYLLIIAIFTIITITIYMKLLVIYKYMIV